ncbi:MAG: hypothetical protein AB7N76_08370 [Planctomycetota bacterium]
MELERHFGLTDDREAFLADLAPGSDDRSYYRCLHLLHEGRREELQDELARWKQREPWGAPRREEIEDRLALLDYPAQPAGERLRQRLGLGFTHERELEPDELRYPSALEPRTTEQLAQEAGRYREQDLERFTALGIERLARQGEPSSALRDALLARLPLPDHEALPQWIAAYLREHDRTFSSAPAIAQRLTLAQLDALAALHPAALQDGAFVGAYLRRLAPPAHEDLEEPAVRGPYLERLRAFAGRLGPAFQTLRLEVLHHLLAHQQRAGRVDPALLREYLELPRHASWVSPDYLRRDEVRRRAISLGSRHETRLETVYDDEPLVRELLEEALRDAPDAQAYAPFVEQGYLRERLVTAKLLAGVGDPEEWARKLGDAALLERLRERVELRFPPTRRERFGRDEEVALELWVKNVRELTIKVFRVNVESVFGATGRAPGIDIDLDGLVPSEERSERLTEPALRRARREFRFPALREPGVYVIDFLGGGRNSRALVVKGGLRLVERPAAAGQVVRVVDEEGRARPAATLVLGGREYRPDDEGRLVLPYTRAPGQVRVLVRDGAHAAVAELVHRAQRCELSAGLHIPREQLVAGEEATVLVRAALSIHGAPADLSQLEDVSLRVASRDLRGVESARDVPLRLDVSDETRHSFRVPPGAQALELALSATLPRAVRGEEQRFRVERSYRLNEVDQGPYTRALYLAETAAGHRLEVRGKNGEPLPRRTVSLRLQPRELDVTRDVVLQTDAEGAVALGDLRQYSWLEAELPGQQERRFELPGERARLAGRIHARAGEELALPCPGAAGPADRRDFALFELTGDVYYACRFAHLRRGPGLLLVAGLPAGSYELHLKREGRVVRLEIGEGHAVDRWLAGPRRLLELRNQRPLAAAPLALEGEDLVIRLSGVTPRTRVHVLGSRWLPDHDAFAELGAVPLPEPRAATVATPPSRYQAERQLPEEVRYVLERASRPAFPGNLLERPSLLLNPWAMRDTSTATDDARGGDAFGARSEAAACFDEAPCAEAEPCEAAGEGASFATCDFLPGPAPLLAGLRPDADGVVRVPLARLAGAQLVTVLALDPQNAVELRLALPPAPLAPRDRRLFLGLDPGERFTQQRAAKALLPGEELVVEDLAATRLARYDSLARVHALFQTLNPSPALQTFAFLVKWPELAPEEQERLYSEHACHELHLFLQRKDPAFFARVIRPYLAHKRDKTFVDRYLLGEDLTAFARPWAYGRLNACERVLLAERLRADGDAIVRELADEVALIPKDPDGEARLFDTALAGQSLDEDDELGIEKQREEVSRARRDVAKEQSKAKKRAARPSPKGGRGAMPSAPPPPPAPSAGAGGMAFTAMLDMEEADDEWGAAERESAVAPPPELYRPQDKTKEWGESDYYRLRPDEVSRELVPANPFWRDFAAHGGQGPFLSPHVAWAASSFAEQALALAALDLPFRAEEPEVAFEGAGMRLRARSPQLVFLQEIRPAAAATDAPPVLVGQKLLRHDERSRYEDGEEVELVVEGELLTQVVYVCQVVVSNPGGRTLDLDLLLQIPRGSLPVAGAQRTESRRLRLGGYETESLEYAFYFPEDGEFLHYPVHVARHEQVLARAEPRPCSVVAEASERDTSSWGYLSQRGGDDEVLAHLGEANLRRLDLSRIAWRMRARPFYEQVLGLLARRHAYHDTLWSYALYHQDAPRTAEYLEHQEGLLRGSGLALEGPLLTVDPVERAWYQHKEYAPLVNARAHRLGDRSGILNDRFRGQWEAFCELARYRRALTAQDRLALVYYLLLQDRVQDALAQLERVPREAVATGLQHDYLSAYAALSRGEPAVARRLAEPHLDHPVPRWRARFRNVLAQLDELASGAAGAAVDPADRDQRQAAQAARDASLQLEPEGPRLRLSAHGLAAVELAYYRMDLELLFSLQPFGWEGSGRFAFTAPHARERLELAGEAERLLDPPAALAGQNLVVEARAEGLREVAALYAHRLAPRVLERYAQVEVRAADGAPLPAVYVKAYARDRDGRVQFYKDGYTDLRGRFDYGSLSTDQLDRVERFALLISSSTHGALVREVSPPQR